MNLDRIAVKIRPRKRWESIDLGFVIARAWFFRLWLLWLVTATPFFALFVPLALLAPGTAYAWCLLLFWLGKPLYEPPLLIWAGRALFAEKMTLRHTLQELKRTASPARFFGVIRHRLSFNRSFLLPVLVLENLRGKTRKKRIALLGATMENTIYPSVAGLCIELMLSVSLLGVAYFLIPEQLRRIDFNTFVFAGDTWLCVLAYVMACSLVAPFYVCCGFMLYISRRVELEAWDIEIGFKAIERRLRDRQSLKQAATLFVLLTLPLCPSLVSASPVGSVVQTPETAKKNIREVLQQREFGEVKTVGAWVPKPRDKKEPGEGRRKWLEWLASVFEQLEGLLAKLNALITAGIRVMVWGTAAAVIVLLVLKYSRLSSWLSEHVPRGRRPFTPPDIIFGLDIRPEHLPDDIPAACYELLEKKERRLLLSLLYRTTLSRLIHTYRLNISASCTEHECLSEVKRYRPPAESSFFAGLTRLWLLTAYGHHEADLSSCRDLIDRWSALYEG